MPRSRIYTAGLRGNVKHFCLTFCTSVVVGHCCGQTIFSKHLQGDSWTWLSEQKIGDDIVTAQRPGWRMGGHTHTQQEHTYIHHSTASGLAYGRTRLALASHISAAFWGVRQAIGSVTRGLVGMHVCYACMYVCEC